MSSTSEKTSAEFANDAVDEHDQSDGIPIATPFPHRVRGDGVAVLPDKPVEVTEGGIVLSETRDTVPCTGRVLALGPGKRLGDGSLEVPDFGVGAKVYYAAYSGTKIEIKHEGRDVLILRLDDVRVVFGSVPSTVPSS